MPVPETQHKTMRALTGRVHIEQASDQLYICALQCRADGHPWPAALDAAHALLWRHIGRDEDQRRAIVGEAGE